VEEVVGTAHAANATVLAMELQLLQIIVKEAALEAAVRAELDPAARARVRHRLPQVAQCAHQLAHCRAVELVPLAGVLRAAAVRISGPQ
jgi:anti-sigma factor RsiW